MPFPDANATLDKPAVRLFLAGTETRNPILAGLAAQASIPLRSGERVHSVTITATEFSKSLSYTTTSDEATTQTIVFGTDTDSGSIAVRHTIVWVTSLGTRKRQFWVKDLPSTGALYVKNTVADGVAVGDEPMVYVNLGAGMWEDKAHFGINILPNFNDECFILGELSTNRYANTLRSWGGAATAQVFLGGAEIISERDVADVHGYFWTVPSYGVHAIVVRLRAATGSANYVDITGSIRVRQIPS